MKVLLKLIRRAEFSIQTASYKSTQSYLENYIFTLQYLNSHYRFPSRLKFSLRLPKLLYCKRKPSLENSTLLRSDHCHLSMQGLAQIGIHLDCASAVRSYTPFFGVVNLTLALWQQMCFLYAGSWGSKLSTGNLPLSAADVVSTNTGLRAHMSVVQNWGKHIAHAFENLILISCAKCT